MDREVDPNRGVLEPRAEWVQGGQWSARRILGLPHLSGAVTTPTTLGPFNNVVYRKGELTSLDRKEELLRGVH